jgi:dTDP-4-amino-4,6-dideoxygalactose transaminase
MGEDVQKLEQEIAAYSQAKFGIGCASGSDALFLALLGLDIQPGDEVLTTPFTFFATAGAIHRAGAVPVFVDIEPATFNMDMNQVADVLAMRPKVKAVVPVHLFGACADLDPLCQMARERGIAVIEDAAQSIGSEYKGRRAGSIGEVGCFSFFPSKNLGGYGDGGMLTTNDPALREKLAALRVHGSKRKYYHDWVGVNSRLDALQAAVLRVKFRYLDSWTAGRQRNAALYRQLLAEMAVPVTPPAAAPYQTRHIYNQFSIICPKRDELQAYLKNNGIGTEVYYPLPLHLQVCFAPLGYKTGDFPVSERLAKESLALPVHSELPAEDVEHVCRTLKAFYS